MNKPEMAYIVIGCIAVFISGGLQPAFAIIFSGALSVSSFFEIEIFNGLLPVSKCD